jgi:hypothetical protein
MPRKSAKRKQPEDPQWYDDDELWLDLLRPLDDSQAENAARLFHRLAEELETGTDGAYRVRCCLENARRLAFPFTKFARDCEVLFQESLDQPDMLTPAQIRDRKRSQRR